MEHRRYARAYALALLAREEMMKCPASTFLDTLFRRQAWLRTVCLEREGTFIPIHTADRDKSTPQADFSRNG